MRDSAVRFNRLLGCLGTALLVAAIPTAAHASDTVHGRWDSNSLRDNRIGYYLTLKPSSIALDDYSGVVQFTYRDGRKGPRMPFTATKRDSIIRMKTESGRFDKDRGPLRGEFSADGGTLMLSNCQDRLRLVMPRALDSDCVFQRADID